MRILENGILIDTCDSCPSFRNPDNEDDIFCTKFELKNEWPYICNFNEAIHRDCKLAHKDKDSIAKSADHTIDQEGTKKVVEKALVRRVMDSLVSGMVVEIYVSSDTLINAIELAAIEMVPWIPAIQSYEVLHKLNAIVNKFDVSLTEKDGDYRISVKLFT